MAKNTLLIPMKENGTVEHYHFESLDGTEVYKEYDPFDAHLPYCQRTPRIIPYNIVENFEFEAELEFDTLTSNYRSGAYATLKNPVTSATYPVFIGEFIPMIPLLVMGKIKDKFTFRKQGCNYSLKLVR